MVNRTPFLTPDGQIARTRNTEFEINTIPNSAPRLSLALQIVLKIELMLVRFEASAFLLFYLLALKVII